MPSVVEQTPYNEYTGNGVATVYPYEFELLDADDLVVTIDGVVIPASDFTLAGVGVQAGGTVTFDTAPANLTDVLLSREIALQRDIDYQVNGDLASATVDLDLNRLWQALQGFWTRITGAIRAPYPEQLDELPAAATRANKVLAFDADGQPTVLIPDSGTAADVLIQLADTSSASNGAALVGYDVETVYTTGVGKKLREFVSAHDFGALGDGMGRLPSDDGITVSSETWNAWPAWITDATYTTKPGHDYGNGAYLAANKPFTSSDTWDFIGITLAMWYVQTNGGGTVSLPGHEYIVNRAVRFVMGASGIGVDLVGKHKLLTRIRPLATMPTVTGYGKPSVYMYRIGLTGASLKNLGVTSFPLTGGTPTPDFASTSVGPNWESTGTFTGAVICNNCDTVHIEDCFFSGYGEGGVVALNQSSIVVRGCLTEYYTISVLLRGGSEAYIEDNVLFSSSGTGVNSWLTSGVYLNGSKAFIRGGQISAMRGWSVYSTGTANEFTFDSVINMTDGYGLIFNCAGLDKWRVTNSNFRYGVPNTHPFVLLDGADGSTRPLNTAFAGGQFANNIISNTGGTSDYATAWITGTGIQVTTNYFGDVCDGSSTGNLVVTSLLNSSYFGPGTVNIQFTGNQLPNATPSMVSVFGIVKDNIFSTDHTGAAFVFATGATATIAPGTKAITNGFAGTLTLTLPAVAQSIGERITVTTVNAQAVVSASSNVSPLAGGADGTAILAATAGKWAELMCDGTSWRIIAGN